MASLALTSFLIATLANLAFGFVASPPIESPKYIFAKVPSSNGIETYNVAALPTTGNANAYMDEVFQCLKKYIDDSGLNDHPLPDEILKFKKKIGPITFKGEIGLENGYIRGLDSIHRDGDCNIKTDGDDLYIDTVAGVTNAKLGYTGVVKFQGHGPSITVSGTVDHASARSTLYVKDLSNITLSYFKVEEVGNVRVHVKGLGIFNWLADVIGDIVAKVAKKFIVRIAEGPMKVEIQKIIDTIPISHLIPDLA